MSEIFYAVENDAVIKYTPMPQTGEYVSFKSEVVMTKKIFQECYVKWVEYELLQKNKAKSEVRND